MGSQCKLPALGPLLKHSQAFVLSLEELKVTNHTVWRLLELGVFLLAGMLFEG